MDTEHLLGASQEDTYGKRDKVWGLSQKAKIRENPLLLLELP
jgi:hypothetical protein